MPIKPGRVENRAALDRDGGARVLCGSCKHQLAAILDLRGWDPSGPLPEHTDRALLARVDPPVFWGSIAERFLYFAPGWMPKEEEDETAQGTGVFVWREITRSAKRTEAGTRGGYRRGNTSDGKTPSQGYKLLLRLPALAVCTHCEAPNWLHSDALDVPSIK